MPMAWENHYTAAPCSIMTWRLAPRLVPLFIAKASSGCVCPLSTLFPHDRGVLCVCEFLGTPYLPKWQKPVHHWCLWQHHMAIVHSWSKGAVVLFQAVRESLTIVDPWLYIPPMMISLTLHWMALHLLRLQLMIKCTHYGSASLLHPLGSTV
jgi:hypothetical protein